jgi:hypothetical protein
MNLDPENCPHCGITWLGEPIPGGGTQGSHYGVNMAILVPWRRGQTYHLCEGCGARTPFGIWNYGYKPEFLAEVFLNGFKRRDDDDER